MERLNKRFGVCTIVKNEGIFLPIWLRYYLQFFNSEDIFILDHETTDGSTNNLNCNVVGVNNQYTWDHEWLAATVSDFVSNLIRSKKYNYILFTEIDEIICADPKIYDGLIDYLKKCQRSCIRCNPYMVAHNPLLESPINLTKPILQQRKWHPDACNGLWCKPLLTKEPLRWTAGFHLTNIPSFFDQDLLLIHLRCIDLDTLYRRSLSRNIGLTIKKDGLGEHNLVTDRNIYCQELIDRSLLLENIPERFRNIV